MKMHLRTLLLALGLSLSFLTACGPESAPPEKLIAKSWKLKSLNIKNQPPPPPQIMAQSSFNFNPNGRYEILMGELERGTWRLSDDKAILVTVPDGGFQEHLIDISGLTDSTLTLTNNGGPAPITMELVPL